MNSFIHSFIHLFGRIVVHAKLGRIISNRLNLGDKKMQNSPIPRPSFITSIPIELQTYNLYQLYKSHCLSVGLSVGDVLLFSAKR